MELTAPPHGRSAVMVTQFIMSNYATEVIRYLDAGGSKIRVLALSPSELFEKGLDPIEQDANGHRWPHYYYGRGIVTDCRGTSKLVADPIANCKAEMRESTIL